MKIPPTALFLLICCVGCGQAVMSKASSSRWADSNSTRATKAGGKLSKFADFDGKEAKKAPMLAMADAMKDAGKAGGIDGAVQASNRKIIYTADIQLVVDKFDGLEKRIAKLVADHGGYLSAANLDRMQGQRRSGRWVARIPVDQYDSFVNAAGDLGVPESRTQNAHDVTEEFVDLTARIDNKKKLEERIVQLLERPDDKIQHVIEVERELARVREDIERMEGRLRFLSDQTELTTVSIAAREEVDYVPPQAPGFGDRIASAWQGGFKNARIFFENLAVLIVYNTIPIALWTAIAVLVAWFVRRRLREAAA